MSIIFEHNRMVAMRDGVKLATDIYRPEEEGQWPVLLTRVPYDKDLRIPFPSPSEKRVFLEKTLDVEQVVRAGYVVVAQDTRGCHASEGSFLPFSQEEATDGADTIAWLARQPWSNGRVGMFGVSYQGSTQWQAAREHPAALQAIAPAQCPNGAFFPYQGGAFQLNPTLETALAQFVPEELRRRIRQGTATPAELEEVVQAHHEMLALYWRLPLVDMPLLEGRAPYCFDWLQHPDVDAYWNALMEEEASPMIVPALILAGWYDYFLSRNLEQYRNLRRARARSQQHLVIGPWTHANFQERFALQRWGEASVGREKLMHMQLRWFDHWLKGIDNGIEQEKPVHLFVMGINVWREEEDWPLPDTQYRPYYLHSGGHANSVVGDGVLALIPATDEPADRYCYDPHDPVPTVGGVIMTEGIQHGPIDQRAVEQRQDVLCYTTAPLGQPVEVTGPIELVLYVSSSALDTDFTAKLVDVFPDGRAEHLVEGILRARYRDSYAQPALLEPGRIYELHIAVGATSTVFLVGHRIRLEVSSSNFPRFDRNSNTGGTIATEEEKDLVSAINVVYHSDAYPSHVLLPLIERETQAEQVGEANAGQRSSEERCRHIQ